MARLCPILLRAYPPTYQGRSGESYYTLHHTEADNSRLRFEPGVGTVLDKSLPREFEFRVYERIIAGYTGLCGQYTTWPDALAALFDLAGLSFTEAPAFHGEFSTTD